MSAQDSSERTVLGDAAAEVSSGSRTSSGRSRTSSGRSRTSSVRQAEERQEEEEVFREAMESSDLFGEVGWRRPPAILTLQSEGHPDFTERSTALGNRLYTRMGRRNAAPGAMLQIWFLIASCIDPNKLSRLDGMPFQLLATESQLSFIELDHRNSIWKKETKQLVGQLALWLTPMPAEDGGISSVFKLFEMWVNVLNRTFIQTIERMNKVEPFADSTGRGNSVLIYEFINSYVDDLEEAKERILTILNAQGETADPIEILNMAKESMNEKIGFDVHEFYRVFNEAIGGMEFLTDDMPPVFSRMELHKITIQHIESRIGSAAMYELVPQLVMYFLNRGEFGKDWIRGFKLKLEEVMRMSAPPTDNDVMTQIDFGGVVCDLPTIKNIITTATMTHLIVIDGAVKISRVDQSEFYAYGSAYRRVLEDSSSTRAERREMRDRNPGHPGERYTAALFGYPENISAGLLDLLKPYYDNAEKVARLGARDFTSISRLYFRRRERDPEATLTWADRYRENRRRRDAIRRREQDDLDNQQRGSTTFGTVIRRRNRLGHGVIRPAHTLKKKTKKGSKKKTKMKRGKGHGHGHGHGHGRGKGRGQKKKQTHKHKHKRNRQTRSWTADKKAGLINLREIVRNEEHERQMAMLRDPNIRDQTLNNIMEAIGPRRQEDPDFQRDVINEFGHDIRDADGAKEILQSRIEQTRQEIEEGEERLQQARTELENILSQNEGRGKRSSARLTQRRRAEQTELEEVIQTESKDNERLREFLNEYERRMETVRLREAEIEINFILHMAPLLGIAI